MKNTVIAFLLLLPLLFSCKGEPTKQANNSQIVEEIAKIDSLDKKLDSSIKEVEVSEEALEAALKALDF